MKTITIIGNLGANAVLRTTSDGRELMSFNVAVSDGKDRPAVWFNCVGRNREKLLPFLLKGQCVCVTGDIAAKIYNNAIDFTVNIDRVELCGAKPEDHTENTNTDAQ